MYRVEIVFLDVFAQFLAALSNKHLFIKLGHHTQREIPYGRKAVGGMATSNNVGSENSPLVPPVSNLDEVSIRLGTSRSVQRRVAEDPYSCDRFSEFGQHTVRDTYKPSAGSMLWSRDDLTEYLLACACQSSHLHTSLPPAAPGKPAEHRDCLPSFHHALILTTGSEAHIYSTV